MRWWRRSSLAAASKVGLDSVKPQQRPGAWAGVTSRIRLEVPPWAQVLREGSNPSSNNPANRSRNRNRNSAAQNFVGKIFSIHFASRVSPIKFTRAHIGLMTIGLENPQQAGYLTI
jgi:hypothetical protein